MAKTYDEAAVNAVLAGDLEGWSFADGMIRKTYKTSSFKGSLLVANAIGHLAEIAFHHPDLKIGYGSIEVSLVSHDAGGITDKDFELARKIDEVILWQPWAGKSALKGAPRDDDRYNYIRY